MEKLLKSQGLNESMLVKTLPSGLKCYIIPKKGFSEKHAMLCVDFGSTDLEFEIDGKKITTPEGIAHFLEHKAFEDEKLDYFDEFTKLSGNVNAYTNFNSTVYYFSAHENFKACLELLFDMVLDLYVTEETVEKEKGIIEQEISMYDDDPSWRVYFNMLQGLYEKSPVRNEIAGSAESIAGIDVKLLRQCFESFYTPANMALICAGDFDEDEIFEVADKKTGNLKSKGIVKIYPDEPIAGSAINSLNVNERMSVAKPLFCFGYKDMVKPDKLRDTVSTKILLDIIAGGSSELYNRLYRQGLLDSGFGMDYSNGSCYSIAMFSGASKNVQQVCGEIIKVIENIKAVGVEAESFERIRKKQLGRYLRSFNSVSTIAGMQADFYGKGFSIFDIVEVMESIGIDDINNRVNECFSYGNRCLSVVDKV